uniref:PRTRC system protein E n=1 Tax=Caballeronia sp. LjRoot34 TaxID=3342325 RepID=UPI003F4FDA35
MFVSLEPLLRSCTKLTLSLQMKGDDVVVFVKPEGSAKDAAMLQPLVLTASAAELDAGFADALAAYTGVRASLADQCSPLTRVCVRRSPTRLPRLPRFLKPPKRRKSRKRPKRCLVRR